MANRRAGVFLIALVQEPLDLESFSADAVGFVPMDFCGADAAVFEPDGSTSFELTPASRAILPAQAGEFADGSALAMISLSVISPMISKYMPDAEYQEQA